MPPRMHTYMAIDVVVGHSYSSNQPGRCTCVLHATLQVCKMDAK